jgi:O-methyltransferase involved in polyketide biosynthesis
MTDKIRENFKENNSELNFENVGTTAMFVAYLRQVSGMPIAGEIAKLANAKEHVDKFIDGVKKKFDLSPEQADELIKKFAPSMELRQLSITNLLKSRGVKNVLEIASGISSRGIEMTQDSEINYVESNMPKMIAEKEKLARHFLPEGRNNLSFVAANALSLDDLKKAVEKLKGPIAIVNEGLLGYLTREEKITVMKNIRQILQEKGGFWVTTDFSTPEDRKDDFGNKELQESVYEMMKKVTSRFMGDSTFSDENEIFNFIEGNGFEVEVLNQIDFSEGMVSGKNLNISEEQIKKMLANKKLYILTLKK